MSYTIRLVVCVLTLLCLSKPALSQNLMQLQDRPLEEILSSIDDIEHHHGASYHVKTIQAVLPGHFIPNQDGHELYTRLFIVISQDGENPPFKVYRLDKLISIGSISIRELNTHMASLEFTEGPYSNRKTIRIIIDSEDLSAKMSTSNR